MSDDTPRRPVLKAFDPNYDKYKRSKKHEDRISKKLGGKRLPRSGGLAWASSPTAKPSANHTLNGDISTPEFHIEHKRTDCASMSVKQEWLEKVSDGARMTGKDPALAITFEKKGKYTNDWIMIPLEVFERLMKLKEILEQ